MKKKKTNYDIAQEEIDLAIAELEAGRGIDIDVFEIICKLMDDMKYVNCDDVEALELTVSQVKELLSLNPIRTEDFNKEYHEQATVLINIRKKAVEHHNKAMVEMSLDHPQQALAYLLLSNRLMAQYVNLHTIMIKK